jgi:hypothetical protein
MRCLWAALNLGSTKYKIDLKAAFRILNLAMDEIIHLKKTLTLMSKMTWDI